MEGPRRLGHLVLSSRAAPGTLGPRPGRDPCPSGVERAAGQPRTLPPASRLLGWGGTQLRHTRPLPDLDLLEVLSDVDEMSRRRPEILGFFSVRSGRGPQGAGVGGIATPTSFLRGQGALPSSPELKRSRAGGVGSPATLAEGGALAGGGPADRHSPADQPAAAHELGRGVLPQPGLQPGLALHPEQPWVSWCPRGWGVGALWGLGCPGSG